MSIIKAFKRNIVVMAMFSLLLGSLLSMNVSASLSYDADTNSYNVRTNVDLETLATMVNNGTYVKGSNVILKSNILLGGVDWEPIGNSETAIFTGVFDGGGHTISGLTINGEKDFMGLFGRSEGVIKNLTVTGATIEGGINVGGVVAYNSGTISNVHFNGAVTGKTNVGGISGASYEVIENSTAQGTITSHPDAGSVQGLNQFGGITGLLSSGKIINSTSHMNVTSIGSAGGIAGRVEQGSSIINVVNKGTLTATGEEKTSGSNDVGGIAGSFNSSNIINAYNEGAIVDVSAFMVNEFGGIVGNAYGDSNLYNIYNIGDVDDDGTPPVPREGFELTVKTNIGSLVGGMSSGADIRGGFILSTNAVVGDGHGIGDADHGITEHPFFSTFDTDGTLTTPIEVEGTTHNTLLSALNAVINSLYKEGTEVTYIKKWISTNPYPTFDTQVLVDMDGWNSISTPGFNGTEYEIETPAELAWVVLEVNDGSAGYDLTEKNIKLMKDINLSEYEWIPLGSQNKSFESIFNGNGHTISGVRFANQGSDLGLFGVVASRGHISNLSVDIDITGTDRVGGVVCENRGTISDVTFLGSVNGENDVGGIVSINKNGTIENSSTSAGSTVTASGVRVGGIVGHNQNGTLTSVTNNATIHENTLIQDVGGIIGYFNGGSLSDIVNNTTINLPNSLNVGGLIGTATGDSPLTNLSNTSDVTGKSNVGGVVGKSTNISMQSCTNSAIVNAKDSYVGGVVGLNDSSDQYSLTGLSNSGTVNGISYVGGIVGQNVLAKIDAAVAIQESKVNGSGNYVGGIVGHSNSEIVNSQNNTASVLGVDHVGGIVGYNTGSINNVTVEYHAVWIVEGDSKVGGVAGTNAGHINNSNSKTIVRNTQFELGGLVGHNIESGIIENSYVTGMVRSSGSNVGGITGYNAGTVIHVYNKSRVVVDSTSYSRSDVGGLVGENIGKVYNSYNAGEITDLKETYSTIGGVVGKNGGVVANVYNTGLLEVNSAQVPVGGVVGTNSATLTNGYYLNTTFSKAIGSGTEGTDIGQFDTDGTLTVSVGSTEFAGLLSALNNGVAVHNTNPDNTGVLKMKAWKAGEPYPVWTEEVLDWSYFGIMVQPNSEGVYEVSNGPELAWIAIEINNEAEGVDLSNAKIVLANPIDLSAYEWIPILRLRGEFDGNNHTISGLRVDGASADVTKDKGLFGIVSQGGTVKNLTVSGSVSGGQSVGGVVGANQGTIDNVRFSGEVEGTLYVGGVVGDNWGGVVTNSYNAATVTSIAPDNSNSQGMIGGVVGRNATTNDATPRVGEVEIVYNNGDVVGGFSDFIGGVVGSNRAILNNAYNTGAVSAANGEYVGGVAGENQSIITNTYNLGATSALAYNGSVIGRNTSGASLTNSYGNAEPTTGQNNGTSTNVVQFNTGGTFSSPITVNGTACDNLQEALEAGKGDVLFSWKVISGQNNGYPVIREGITVVIPPVEPRLENGTYYIGIAAEFIWFANEINDGSKGSDVTNANVKLTQNIDLSGVDFTPIGNSELGYKTSIYDAATVFHGNFDGGGFSINNLKIDVLVNSNYPSSAHGLFTVLGYGGSIKNLRVFGDVYVDNENIVGGIVGVNLGTVENVGFIGDVSLISAKGEYVGGIVGQNYAYVKNCFSQGSVLTENPGDSPSFARIGGLVGSNGGSIIGSHNEATVTTIDGEHSLSAAGGIAGYSTNTILNCYNVGVVEGGYNVGGLVGYSYRLWMSNSYNLANVTGDHYVGGIIGRDDCGNNTTSIDLESTVLRNVYNAGVVKPDVPSTTGAILGYMENGMFGFGLYWLDGTSVSAFSTTSESGTNIDDEFSFLMNSDGIAELDLPIADSPHLTTVLNSGTNDYNEFNPETPASSWVTGENGMPTFVGSAWQDTEDNSGIDWTATDISITTAEQLAAFAKLVSQGNDFSGKNIKLNNNINLIGSSFTSIGTQTNGFAGTFDGNNLDVTGLNINSAQDYQGLFANIEAGGVVKNLVVIGSVSGGDYTGGVVGINNGSIENVYFIGEVMGDANVGGIAGRNNSTISESYTTGSVEGNQAIGGVVGNNTGSVKNLYNESSVISIDENGGGIVGNNSGVVANSYNTANVSAKSAAGGIVGANLAGGSTTNVYNLGTVTATTQGGVVGTNSGTVTKAYWLQEGATEGIGDGNGTDVVSFTQAQGGTFNPSINEMTQLIDVLNDGRGEEFSWAVAEGANSGYPTLQQVFITTSQEVTLNGDSYVIENAQQLAWVANEVNKGTDFSGKTIELKGNIDLSERNWTPIGTVDNPFTATFDGNNFTISNLHISSKTDRQGLFGVVGNEGAISDVRVSGEVVGAGMVGGLVGENKGTISNVAFIGSVNGATNMVGGISGSNTGTVSNAENNAVVNGVDKVGGVIGDNGGNAENLQNDGGVFGKTDVGGVVGNSTGAINGAINFAIVNGSKNAGGVVGNTSTLVNNTHNRGTVGGGEAIGGVAGNSGSRLVNSSNIGNINGHTDVGGIVATGYTTIVNVYNHGDVTATDGDVGAIAADDYETTIYSAYNVGSILHAKLRFPETDRIVVDHTDLDLATIFWLDSDNATLTESNFTADNGGTFVTPVKPFGGIPYNRLVDALNAAANEYNKSSPTTPALNWFISQASGYPELQATSAPKYGDVNNDNVVDILDLEIISSFENYNKDTYDATVQYESADVNGDGKINFADLAIVRNSKNFGQ